jgi:hypothetical protein|tara:strand:+ start:2046 stop:2576 length:531 start_codon:yes stop_codon:yes gene_type:complete
MERRINKKIETHFVDFKSQIIERLKVCNGDDIESDSDVYKLVEFIYNFPKIEINTEDIKKRKRVKNIVPFCDKCQALRANGMQCSRRKKDGNPFCGTHIKGTPHGHIKNKPPVNPYTKRTVWIQEINGICYYIDGETNVYESSDIVNNKSDPRIIAKYQQNAFGEYSIPSFKSTNP